MAEQPKKDAYDLNGEPGVPVSSGLEAISRGAFPLDSTRINFFPADTKVFEGAFDPAQHRIHMLMSSEPNKVQFSVRDGSDNFMGLTAPMDGVEIAQRRKELDVYKQTHEASLVTPTGRAFFGATREMEAELSLASGYLSNVMTPLNQDIIDPRSVQFRDQLISDNFKTEKAKAEAAVNTGELDASRRRLYEWPDLSTPEGRALEDARSKEWEKRSAQTFDGELDPTKHSIMAMKTRNPRKVSLLVIDEAEGLPAGHIGPIGAAEIEARQQRLHDAHPVKGESLVTPHGRDQARDIINMATELSFAGDYVANRRSELDPIWAAERDAYVSSLPTYRQKLDAMSPLMVLIRTEDQVPYNSETPRRAPTWGPRSQP